MSTKHKLVWVGTVLLVLCLFFTMVRGLMSFALFIGASLLLVLFVSDVLNRRLIRALRGLPTHIWKVFWMLPP
jgi:hypothetical protein